MDSAPKIPIRCFWGIDHSLLTNPKYVVKYIEFWFGFILLQRI